jgi:plastocyanin
MKSFKFFKPALATTLAIGSWRFVLLLATAVSLIGYPKPASAATVNVTVGVHIPLAGFRFVPSLVTIHPGDEVKWTWASSGHSTTSDNGIWDSGVRSQGATFTHTFDSVGTFTYHCIRESIYPEVGHVIVANPTPTPTPPTATTNPATSVASFSATLNGSLNPRGSTTTVSFQYGLTTSYGSTTPAQTQTGNTVRAISSNIISLTANTTYHFRIVAHDGGGTSFGGDSTFTTLSPTGPPVVTTNPATLIASFSATLNGSVDPHGLATSIHFQYGTTTSYGLTTAPQIHTGNIYLNVSANISSLSGSTVYHFRIVASNSAGTTYGSDTVFTTLSATGPPVVTTSAATNISTSSATLNGSLDPHGLTTSVSFQYGTTTSYGSTTASQTKTGNTYQSVSANISGLAASTTYHFRILATNSAGTSYGTDRTLTTQ